LTERATYRPNVVYRLVVARLSIEDFAAHPGVSNAEGERVVDREIDPYRHG
jgi:hypothetical protein